MLISLFSGTRGPKSPDTFKHISIPVPTSPRDPWPLIIWYSIIPVRVRFYSGIMLALNPLCRVTRTGNLTCRFNLSPNDASLIYGSNFTRQYNLRWGVIVYGISTQGAERHTDNGGGGEQNWDGSFQPHQGTPDIGCPAHYSIVPYMVR